MKQIMKNIFILCTLSLMCACVPGRKMQEKAKIEQQKQRWKEAEEKKAREEKLAKEKREALVKWGKECPDPNLPASICSCYDLYSWRMSTDEDNDMLLLRKNVINEKGADAWNAMPESRQVKALSEKILTHCRERASLLAAERAKSKAAEIYDCKQSCGFCDNNDCCGFADGFIESTDNPDEYRYVHIDEGFKENPNKKYQYVYVYRGSVKNYSFYKLPEKSPKGYDKYETRFPENVEPQILHINRSEKFASFSDGIDQVVECGNINN